MVVIEIFTRKNCAFCPEAKEICEKVAKEFDNVEVKLIDIETEGKEKAEFLNIITVPVVLIDNKVEFTGVPREELVRSALKQAIGEKSE